MKILIFGGTMEGRKIANILGEGGHNITTSLAGRTTKPKLPEYGKIHIGGFGGIDNLFTFFVENNFDYIIDATHPYAQNISNQLVEAAKLADKKLLRFNRPIWQKPKDTIWYETSSLLEAINNLPPMAKVFLSTGHKELNIIKNRHDVDFFIRLIEPAKIALSKNTKQIISTPPYDVQSEKALFKKHEITHLISKNSGSDQTKAKIIASAELGIKVFMITRPKLKPATEFFSIKALMAQI